MAFITFVTGLSKTDLNTALATLSRTITQQIEQTERRIMTAMDDLATQLTGIKDQAQANNDQLVKAYNELLTAISSTGTVSPEVQAAADALGTVIGAQKQTAQDLDDLVADTTPE